MTLQEQQLKELSESYHLPPQMIAKFYELCDLYGSDPNFLKYLEGDIKDMKPSKIKFYNKVFGKDKINEREYINYDPSKIYTFEELNINNNKELENETNLINNNDCENCKI